MFFLIRPVGLSCQCKCGYCYYKDGHQHQRTVSDNVMDLCIIQKLLVMLPQFPQQSHTFCLHGGEPLLSGKKWFSDFLTLVNDFNNSTSDIKVHIALQTNALLIDNEWIELFKSGGVGVSISIDGPAKIHDFARVDSRGAGTYTNVMSSIARMSQADIPIGAIAVLTKKTMEVSPLEFYSFFQSVPLKNGLDISPYIETGTTEAELSAKYRYEPSPEEVSIFLRDLFDIWLYQPANDNRVEIRMFEQLVGILCDFIPTLCSLTKGASCGRTPSILPNGDVFACDLDAWHLDFKLGSIVTDSIQDIFSLDRINRYQEIITNGYQVKGCIQCEIVNYCGLTCPRHTFSQRDHSGHCKMMKELVSHAKQKLSGISSAIFSENIEFK